MTIYYTFCPQRVIATRSRMLEVFPHTVIGLMEYCLKTTASVPLSHDTMYRVKKIYVDGHPPDSRRILICKINIHYSVVRSTIPQICKVYEILRPRVLLGLCPH